MAMTDVISRLSVWLGIDTAAFERGADISEKRLKKMEREFERSGKKIAELGKKFTAALTVPLLGTGIAVVKMAGDFESSMIKLAISSQATAGELRQMSDLALKLGKDTIFGASDAANAMDELAKSGLSATDILNGAAEATVYLATAAGSELSPAANAITDSMQQFGLTTAQLPDAINQITGAVNQSKLDFEDFALAIGQAGGVAGGLGVEFDDFNTVLAATSSLFASGSDAGTSFKTFLTSLAGNSKQAKDAIAAFGLQFYDANGGLRSMAEIAEELRQKLGGLNEQAKTEVLKTIFGTDAMRTAIGLMNQGAEGLDNVAAAIAKTDAAAQSAQRLQGFYGQLENLKGAIETLAIRIGQSGVLEAITALTTRLGDFVDGLSETSPGVLKFVAIVATIAAAIGPVIIAVGVLKSALAPLWVALKVGLPSLTLLRLELAALSVTGGATAVTMRLLAVAFRGLLIATGVGAAVFALVSILEALAGGMDDASRAARELKEQTEDAEANLNSYITKLRAAGVSTDDLGRISAIAAGKVDKLAASYNRASVEAHRLATNASMATIEILKQQAAISAQSKVRQAGYERELRDAQRERGPSIARFGNAFVDRNDKKQRDIAQKIADEKRLQNVAEATQEAVTLAFKKGIDLRGAGGDQQSLTSTSDTPETADAKRKGRKGPKDRTDQLAARAAQDQYNLEIERLRAQAALTTDTEEKADFERQIFQKERDARYAELDASIKSGDLTQEQAQAQRQILEELYGKRDAEAKSGEIIVNGQKSLYGEQIERERRLQLFQEERDLAETRYRAEADSLQDQFALADTDADRKRIALQILEAEDAYLRSKLNAVIANNDLARAVRDQAQIELDALNASTSARRAVVSRQNETQVERFIRDLNKTPAQINEAIDAIKINGLQSLNDQIANAIVNFKSMGDVFANVVKQMLADLLRLQLQKTLIAPLAKFLGLGDQPSSGLGSIGSAVSKIGNALGGIKIGANANGTSHWGGGPSLLGERGPELVDLPRGARVTPNNDLRGMMGGGIAEIVPSPYFDVVVDGRVMRAAPGIATAGAQGGASLMAYRQSRRWR